ncbi:heavy metal translocating P-type ATPase [Paraglaciecola aquimarina]|uniref:Heavy metal translocating P-type ATPase n=1 Tax=Paraglaciecola aquimarina TaxID=1235557 RepID=A0ABU3SYK9_9ALTE|nr:heavy metal translocating P-type ATPase [Paraglaciecola aquimarina]MDU0355091.1 heavy metal translocating P-type ATPase [Paraglaciecola aquimarina]
MTSLCFHCGLENSPHLSYSAEILGECRNFCCPGCLAVAEAISQNGLEDYYHYRNEFADKADQDPNDALQTLGIFDDNAILDEFVDTKHEVSEIQLTISGINCAACGWLIEKQLSKLTGIIQIGVNVSARRATVKWNKNQLKLSQILSRIEQIGYHAKPFQPEQHEATYRSENKAFLKRLGLAGLMTMQVMMLNLGVFFDLFGHIEVETKQYFNWVSLLLTTPVILYSAAEFFSSAARAVAAKTVNMDVPICIALSVIYATSILATVQQSGQTYFESLCMFVFLLLISRYLEHGARYKASQVSANLLEYMPTIATLIDDPAHVPVLAKSLKVKQKVLIKAGELVPVDGKIIDGEGELNEAMLTGEFDLVYKRQGDQVYAGTVNQLGTLIVEVTNTLKHSMLQQISKLQTQAMTDKPRIASLADTFSQYFVAGVLVIAALTYFVWLSIDESKALWIMISVLIATCPCALGLATPSALSCAVANLNKNGILLKRTDAIEKINKINWVGLDKTGTLTEGKFTVQRCINMSSLTDDQVMCLASSLEQYSSHPIAHAFEHKVTLEVSNFTIDVGLGISGFIGGKRYKMGALAYMDFSIPEQLKDCNVFLQSEQQLIAGMLLTDKIRVSSEEFINQSKGKHFALISGDSPSIVSQVATQLAIDEWYAEQTPQGKLDIIRQAQKDGKVVLMVGDGINDGPVLAQADVSIALGAGSDLAKSSADIILLDNQLDKLNLVFRIAQRTRAKIIQNFSWAIGYNILVLPLAFTGYLSPWMAVLGMSLSSLVVVVNSIKLLK